MQELIFLLIPAGALFWRLGGWYWKGWKVYVFPIIAFFILKKYNLAPGQVYGIPITLGIIAALPRGKGERLRINILVAVCYCLPGFFLSFNIWDILPGVIFMATLLSSYYLNLQWAIAEILTGGAVALPVAVKIFYLTNIK
jgi:hypothetical protein